MCRLRSGFAPSLGALLVCLGPLALAGCATSAAEPSPASQAVAQSGRADMEADGLPAQAAPPARIRQLPDDPAEPFSPNYGAPRPPVRMTSAQEDAIIARAALEHEMRRP